MIFLFILLFASFSQTGLQAEKYRIFLKDKGTDEFRIGSELFEKSINSLSHKSINRRKKVFRSDSMVTLEDVPLPNEYLMQISETGAKILLKLKWLNYVVVEATQRQISDISKLKFVKFIQPIKEKVPKDFTQNIHTNHFSAGVSKLLFINDNTDILYGESINQWKMLSIDKLHSSGFFGDSVIFGIIDTGFRWKQNKIFQNASVLDEFDFLYLDKITENEDVDTIIQDSHGTMVFSIIAGIKEGYLLGGSPFSSFLLAKTEDYRLESHFEEDCFAAAVEWMDSIGVDIISSSLGYSKFDSTEQSYTFEDFDGKSALVSAYANRAKSRGITMIASAGNRGPADSTIQSPAEALGEIAVGAVNPSADTVLKFSSRGPTYDGRIKPDFVAQGNNVVCAPSFPFDTVMYGNGTSVAGPIFASGVALLLSAFEELTPDTIYSILKAHSSKKDNPDNSWGYGIVNFYQTALDYNILISPPITFFRNGIQRVVFIIKSTQKIESAQIYYRKSTEINYKIASLTKIPWSDSYYFDIFPEQNDTLYYLYVLAKTSDGRERRKPFYSEKEFAIYIGSNSRNTFILQDPLLNVAQREKREGVRLFPTILERTNELFVEIGELNENKLTIEIYNNLGEIQTSMAIEASNNTLHKIDFQKLHDGIYFVKITTPSGRVFVSKIAKFF